MVTCNLRRAASPRLFSILSGVLVATAMAGSSQARPAPAPPAASASASTSAPAVSSAPPPPAPSAPSAPSAAASASAPPQASAKLPAQEQPRILHAPPSIALSGAALELRASMEYPDRIRRALLIYRDGAGAEQEVEFRRAPDGPYAAQTAPISGPELHYCIELEMTNGQRLPAFATRGAMHEVQVRDPEPIRREKALLERLDGRRSVVTSAVEYVRFGQVEADVKTPAGTLERRAVEDQYYRIEAGYTYRLLGTITEFGIRGGVVRGRSLVPGQTDPSKYDVGLNYGAPTLRLRLDDGIHVDGTLLTSVTEVGFSTGGGAAVLLGDPYGRKLTLGFESIQTFGTRFYSRLDLALDSGLGIAPLVEVTNMPHSDRYGVRLLTEVTFPLSKGLLVAGRFGYQARDADSGGLSAGASMSYAF